MGPRVPGYGPTLKHSIFVIKRNLMGFNLLGSFSSFISTMLWDFAVLKFHAFEILTFVGLTLNAYNV